jgi:putative heme iron utilization protein
MATMDEVDLPAPLLARRLLRAARSGTLATQADGQPFAALATPATAPDLSILLWLSMLSEHTRQLRDEPRCALLVAGEPADGVNPQTAPRVTVTGIAEVINDTALKARWLAVHPYASLYAEFPDFALWRIRLRGGQLVGGFARAHRLRTADLAPDPAQVAAIAAAADEIMSHVNADHPDALAAIIGTDAACRMVGVDIDGFDLAIDEASPVRRIAFPEPVADPNGVRIALIRMARAAWASGTA